MRQPTPDYWFAAKRYGWGWTLNSNWRGWVCFAIFFAAVGMGIVFGHPKTHPLGFVLYNLVVIGALVLLCWLKGEPPSWRWDKKPSARDQPNDSGTQSK